MQERNFTNELKATFRDISDTFYHKIADMPHFPGSKMRFDVKKPFDIFAVVRGEPLAIEAKMIKKWQPFGLKELRSHQIEALDAFAEAGGSSYVYLNVRIPYIKDKQQRENRLIIFDWDYLKAADRIPTKTLKTLTYIQGTKGTFPQLKEFL